MKPDRINGNMIAPSLLSADFSNLEKSIRHVELGGADLIHCDVMDGRFVPNISFGPMIISAAQRCTKIPMDVHLMIVQPEEHLDAFLRLKPEFLTFHIEASVHADRTVQRIKESGVKAGLSLNPSTHISAIEYLLEKIDLVLVMSVNPGFGGQKFIDYTLRKTEWLAAFREKHGLTFKIEMDGGIGESNIKELQSAGCDIFVAGSSIFSDDNPTAATMRLKKLLNYEGNTIK